MEAIRRLVGIAVADERPLAGRIVGWMFVVGAILTTLLPLLPGANGKVLTPTLPIVIVAARLGPVRRAAHGLAAHARLGDPRVRRRRAWRASRSRRTTPAARARPRASCCCSSLVFAAYFFPAREAWPYFGARARRSTRCRSPTTPTRCTRRLLGELLILGPCYWLLAFLLITGKRGMVELRGEADALARRDPLTGLANRRALLEAIERARRGRSGC